MPKTITMPMLSPTMAEGIIAKWVKKEGERVEVGDVLCEITTDKSTVECEAYERGYLKKVVIPEGGNAKVNQGIAIIVEHMDEDISNYKLEEPNLMKEAPSEKVEPQKREEIVVERAQPVYQMAGFSPVPPRVGVRFMGKEEITRVLATPLAKRIALEKGLDLTSVKGTGPNGRVTAKDLELALPASPFTRKKVPSELPPGSYEEIVLSPMRKAIGNKLQASKASIPHIYITQEIRADRMIVLRNELKEGGIKPSYNDFVIKAVALALRKHPEINSGFNSVDQKIIRFLTIDISVAVSIPEGLITPIITYADYKSIQEISAEVKELAKKAKEGKLAPEEYQGGSFTISNLGMFGVYQFDAVINPPQAAILSVGGIFEKPVVSEGKIEIGNVMHVTVSADHRVIDGAEAANFLKSLKTLLENPSLLLV